MLLADRGYDADWIRALASEQGAWANIPPKRNRKEPICFSPYLYRALNLVERFFNKIKQCGASLPDTTISLSTISPSSSSHPSSYGCGFMSLRPSQSAGSLFRLPERKKGGRHGASRHLRFAPQVWLADGNR